MQEENAVQALTDLGLTGLEAEIYICLLGESPATGYRIAQAIGKPTGNTYKAIETLAKKGAIIMEEEPRRQYRAVPHEEFLLGLERAFRKRRSRAKQYLSSLPLATDDDKIYRLHSREQVMERARSMLKRARMIAILDIFPGPLEELAPDIERCAARGVDVTVKIYDAAKVNGARVVVDFMNESIVARWPGQWLNLVIDSSEHLLVYLSKDCASVHQAVWSRSVYLSSSYHGGIHAEITLDEIGYVLQQGGSIEEIRDAFSRFRRPLMLDSPGYHELMKSYGGTHESNRQGRGS